MLQTPMYSYKQVWSDDSREEFSQVTTREFENTCFISECSIVEHYLKIKYTFRIFFIEGIHAVNIQVIISIKTCKSYAL
jgi:hypothetical protein